jgi:hypothetical protein
MFGVTKSEPYKLLLHYMNEQFTSIFEELSGTSRERGTLGDIYNTLQPGILKMSSHIKKNEIYHIIYLFQG